MNEHFAVYTAKLSSEMEKHQPEPLVMYDSPEAARPLTREELLSFEGRVWMSRKGRVFIGDGAQHLARYDGSTHAKCKDCGATVRYFVIRCDSCVDASRRADYAQLPRHPWPDHGHVYDQHTGEWFHNPEGFLQDYQGEDFADAMLFAGEPVFAHPIEEDLWADDLPEDGEMPEELLAIIREANKKIAAIAEPLTYTASKRAVETPKWEQSN